MPIASTPAHLSSSILSVDGTLLVQLVIFFIAFFALRAFVFKPMVQLFEARDMAVDGAREEAKRLDEDASEKFRELDERLLQVRIQASEERERLRQAGLEQERAMLDKARAETDDKLAKLDAQLTAEANRLRAELKERVPELSRAIVDRALLRRES